MQKRAACELHHEAVVFQGVLVASLTRYTCINIKSLYMFIYLEFKYLLLIYGNKKVYYMWK